MDSKIIYFMYTKAFLQWSLDIFLRDILILFQETAWNMIIGLVLLGVSGPSALIYNHPIIIHVHECA